MSEKQETDMRQLKNRTTDYERKTTIRRRNNSGTLRKKPKSGMKMYAYTYLSPPQLVSFLSILSYHVLCD